MTGCGDSPDPEPSAATPAPRERDRPAPARPGGAALTQADAEREGVVLRRWADAMRRADTGAAARLFVLPAVVAPDPAAPPLRLTTAAEARRFHEGLPCGSRLERVTPHGRYVIATFRLTERPRGDCGSGTGELASVAFLMRAGRVVEWRRVPVPSSGPSDPVPPAETQPAATSRS